MRVLTLLSDTPVPANQGRRVALSTETRALRSAGLSVDCVALTRGNLSSEDLAVLDEFGERVRVVRRRGLLASTVAAPGLPYQMSSMHLTRGDLGVIRRWPRPDVILCHQEWTLPAGRRLQKIWPGTPMVLRSHNDERRYMADWVRASRGARNIYSRLEFARLRDRVLRSFTSVVDEVWLISEEDRGAYDRLGLETRVLRPIAPVQKGQMGAGSRLARNEGAVFGFLGGLHIPHCVEGIDWFLESVWPRIADELPSASFAIAGFGASPDLCRRLSSINNVRFMGEVRDPMDLYSRISVFVNPVFKGSGVNIKMLAPAQLGLPIVSTRVGLRGLGALGLAPHDSPDEFAAECIRLAGSLGYRTELAERLIAGVEEHSTDAYERMVQESIAEVVCKRSAGRADRT